MRRLSLCLFLCITASEAQEYDSPDGELGLGVPGITDIPNNIVITQTSGSKYFDNTADKLTYEGNFHLTSDTSLELLSDHAIFNLKTGKIDLRGNVTVFNGGILKKGDSAVYHFQKDTFVSEGLAISAGPPPELNGPTVLLESGKFKSAVDKNNEAFYIGENAGITTHDVKDPNFWLRADTIKFYPDKRVTFKDVKLYAGDTPIFWLPYFSQPLDSELGYHFIPGVRSTWGAYLLNSYGIMITGDEDSFLYDDGQPWLKADFLTDLRSRKGLGLGVDFSDVRLKSNPNLTGLKLYYANDLDPQATRSGITRDRINEDRYRASLLHRLGIKEGTNSSTYLDTNLTWMSDEHFREDFEPQLYRIDPNPDNTLSLLHHNPRFLAGVTSRLRLNHFYDTSTKSPEIFLDFLKSPILDTPLLYEGHLSAGKYKEFLGDPNRSELEDTIAALDPDDPTINDFEFLLENRGYNRFHTYHELSLPIRTLEGVGIVPHAGAGYTSYWDIENGLNSFDRTLFQAGVDFSLKFSKRYDHIENKKLGIDGLLHTIQPYANFTVLKTDAFDSSFQQIDRLSSTTELRPIKVGRFSAIDELNEWSIARLGVRNHLFTKRDGSTHPWLTMNSFLDVFIDDPEFDREVSNFYNEIAWNPKPWLALTLNTQFPFFSEEAGFSEHSINSNFMPNRNTEISLGYRFLSSHPTLEDSSTIDLKAYRKFNEEWGASAVQSWELDDGTLQSQQYSLHRDLGSWTGSLGFLHRDNRIKDEFGFNFTFTLKEFPSISIPVSLDTE